MTKLKDMAIGDKIVMRLITISSSICTTKSGKEYLRIVLFDGYTQIDGVCWEWASISNGIDAPKANTVLDITGTVGEYIGSKQLTISRLTISGSQNAEEFAPHAEDDVDEIYEFVEGYASIIKDKFYNKLCVSVLKALESKWKSTPAAVKVHHAYKGGLLKHSESVLQIADNISKSIMYANRDLVLAGALLHDVGKCFAYRINGAVCEMTTEGMLCEHSYIGASFIEGFVSDTFNEPEWNSDEVERKTKLLCHIILSHHGTLEHGAAVEPGCIEAYIVHYADELDSKVEQILSAKEDSTILTERIWGLGNKSKLLPEYVERCIHGNE